MLKNRILTALVLIPIFLLLLFFLPPAAFCVATGLVFVYAAWEWTSFLGVNQFPQVLIFPMLIAIGLLLCLFLPVVTGVFGVFALAFCWWIIAAFLVFFYPRGSNFWGGSIILRSLMGFLVLVPSWLALNIVRNSENGIYILLFLFILIWAADSAAYFAGKQWGKHKLLPEVSPGKTWEGLAGALVFTIVIAFVALIGFNIPTSQWPWSILLVIITVLFSVVGDLFESMMKRNVGLKDSGSIFPGHGGLLDRIDSLTAAAPIFTLGAMIMWMEFR